MEGFNNELMEKEEATKSVEQKFKDAKVGYLPSLSSLKLTENNSYNLDT